MKKDSFIKKYIYKLSTNVVALLSNIIIQFIVPRALGPNNYGIYNYLFSFFQQTTNLAELGTNQGYFTKLSKRQNEKGLITYYFLFIILVSALIIFFIFLFQYTGVYLSIWPDQKLVFIYMAAFIGLFTLYSNVLLNTSDALGFTVSSEKVKIQQKIISLFILIVIFVFGELNIKNFFIFNILTLSLLIIHLFYKIFVNEKNSYKSYFFKPNFKKYTTELYSFSKPLFFLGIVGTFVTLFDRWLLQIYFGNEEQGFFGIALQLSYVCLLFSTAMTPLITREFSIAFSENKINEISSVFRKYIPTIYSFVCFISCFIAINSTDIIVTMAGESFFGASIVVAIMSFYPIHQVYGQLGGSVFMASGKTNIYTKIGILTLIPGVGISYFLIGPTDMNCLNLGGIGLAIKMVLIQIISVNIQLFFIAKYLSLNFKKYMLHQIFVIVIFLALAIFSNNLASFILEYGKIHYQLLFNFIVYTILTIIITVKKPRIFGMKKGILQLVKEYNKN